MIFQTQIACLNEAKTAQDASCQPANQWEERFSVTTGEGDALGARSDGLFPCHPALGKVAAGRPPAATGGRRGGQYLAAKHGSAHR